MSSARVFSALLQDFLLGITAGDKIAIHADIATVDRLCHSTPPNSPYNGVQYIKSGEGAGNQDQGRLSQPGIMWRTEFRTSPYWEMIMSDVLLIVKVRGRLELGSSLRGSRMKLKL